MFDNLFVSAVIVAAGSSSRMRSGISKQLMTIGGKTVLQHTVSAFFTAEIIDEIVVVCPENEIESFKGLFSEENSVKTLVFTVGGSTRQQSVFNGVSAASKCADILAIHDGARPLVTPSCIKSVVEDCVKFSASTLAVPVKDTIKVVKNGTVAATPDRGSLFAIQTPQVFRREMYLRAYERAAAEGKDYTDDCQLIESIGESVHITLGDYTNIKITTIEDIAVAEAFLKTGGGVN